MIRVRVLFFAALRERAQRSEVEVDLADGATVARLWDTLCDAYPAIVPMSRSVSFAVNQEYVGGDTALAAGDEVALIPPVSGG